MAGVFRFAHYGCLDKWMIVFAGATVGTIDTPEYNWPEDNLYER